MSDVNPYDLSTHRGLLDLNAGGHPRRTYVGKDTTVADVQAKLARLAARVAELEAREKKLLAFVTLCSDPLRRAFGPERSNWAEVIAYNAARAEVKP